MSEEGTHAQWRAVMAGAAPLTWSLWAAAVASTEVLTPTGRTVLRGAVAAIAGFFGESWLADAYARQLSDPEARKTGLPFMSYRWSPDNNAEHVYRRVLALGARLQLVTGLPGSAQVRRDLTRDLGHFAHGLLQIEVAALALRDGYTVVLEPKPDSRGNRRADLLLDGGSGPMLVETKMFRLNQVASGDVAASSRVMDTVRHLEWRYDVQITGEVAPLDDELGVDGWLEEVDQLASRVARLGITVDLKRPFGSLQISPGAGSVAGASLTIPVRNGDEWSRISDQIAKKAEQGRGDAPLWLRFDQTPEFWNLSAPAGPPHREWVDLLARAVEAELDDHPHVAGVVLSSPPFGVAGGGLNSDVPVGDRSVVLGRNVAILDWRETLIVPGRSWSTVQPWSDWYQNERGWLGWALNELDLPAPDRLFVSGAA